MKKYLLPVAIFLGILLSITVYFGMKTQDARVFEPIVCSQEPTATISLVAPKQARIGELVILDASASKAISFKWKVIPETKDFAIIEDGKRAFFTSRGTGTYLFVISAAQDNTVDLVVHEIQIKLELMEYY